MAAHLALRPLKIWRKLGCVTLGCSTFKVKLTWDMNMSNEGEVFLQPRTTSRPRFTLDWEDEKVWPHSCKWPGAQQGPGRCNGKHQTGSPGLSSSDDGPAVDILHYNIDSVINTQRRCLELTRLEYTPSTLRAHSEHTPIRIKRAY